MCFFQLIETLVPFSFAARVSFFPKHTLPVLEKF